VRLLSVGLDQYRPDDGDESAEIGLAVHCVCGECFWSALVFYEDERDESSDCGHEGRRNSEESLVGEADLEYVSSE
jgi:hypothetical protein